MAERRSAVKEEVVLDESSQQKRERFFLVGLLLAGLAVVAGMITLSEFLSAGAQTPWVPLILTAGLAAAAALVILAGKKGVRAKA